MKLTAIFTTLLAFAATTLFAQEKTVLRVGHFPNITHAQALVARQLERQGKGWYQERIPGVEIQWYSYNAGPSAMEAIFADSIDLTYVGPNPILNAYTKSRGAEGRVVSGAAYGGAALVVRPEAGITKPADFRGKKIATPQLGNTQDIAARVYFKKQGYKITQLSGEVLIVPTENPDQLNLLQSGKLDGAWTVEPWVTRLEREAGGKIFLEQKDELGALLVSSVKALNQRGDLVKKFVAAHVELTKWITEHPDEARELVRAELKELTKREFPAETAAQAWPRLRFSSEIKRETLDTLAKEAQDLGFLKGVPDLGQLLAIP